MFWLSSILNQMMIKRTSESQAFPGGEGRFNVRSRRRPDRAVSICPPPLSAVSPIPPPFPRPPPPRQDRREKKSPYFIRRGALFGNAQVHCTLENNKFDFFEKIKNAGHGCQFFYKSILELNISSC
jgi:hypothetical protein